VHHIGTGTALCRYYHSVEIDAVLEAGWNTEAKQEAECIQ
jgi:hypothetical protein